MAVRVATYLDHMAVKQKTITDEVKALLMEPHKRIALHDLAMRKVDEVLVATNPDALPANIEVSPEEVDNRLKQYESIISELEALVVLTAYWGNEEHHLALQKVLTRLAENEWVEQTNNFWLKLRWYPLARIMYAGGIATIAAGQYKNLAALLMGWVGLDTLDQDVIAISGLKKASSYLNGLIQRLPQFGRQYTPVSDYLFSSLQPSLEKLLVVGKRYEALFDRFELLVALLHKDLVKRQGAFYGRFVWKYKRFDSDSPRNLLFVLQQEAKQDSDNWPVFQAGLFGSSLDRFTDAYAFVTQQIEILNWE